eukprot:SAG11_NODE_2932_length_2830_cov_1.773709_1_plen_176_part_00
MRAPPSELSPSLICASTPSLHATRRMRRSYLTAWFESTALRAENAAHRGAPKSRAVSLHISSLSVVQPAASNTDTQFSCPFLLRTLMSALLQQSMAVKWHGRVCTRRNIYSPACGVEGCPAIICSGLDISVVLDEELQAFLSTVRRCPIHRRPCSGAKAWIFGAQYIAALARQTM